MKTQSFVHAESTAAQAFTTCRHCHLPETKCVILYVIVKTRDRTRSRSGSPGRHRQLPRSFAPGSDVRIGSSIGSSHVDVVVVGSLYKISTGVAAIPPKRAVFLARCNFFFLLRARCHLWRPAVRPIDEQLPQWHGRLRRCAFGNRLTATEQGSAAARLAARNAAIRHVVGSWLLGPWRPRASVVDRCGKL